MPKATTRRTSHTSSDKPYTRARRSKPTQATPEKRPKNDSGPSKRSKDPKASHLYTDDNPRTTLHGTGFKDRATAQHTLALVSQRSLTYQFQTINTMFFRAKHHPRSKDSAGMQDAMAVFGHWLDTTYPALKADRARNKRDFKPLLTRATVSRYRERLERFLGGSGEVQDQHCCRFVAMYVDLAKGKRLGNVLLDDEKPEGPDWEIERERRLGELVDERERDGLKDEAGLWAEEDGIEKTPSGWHMRCIGWAWSPVTEKKL